ncbi:reverse transcriptase family protein [Sulfurovum sp. XTW-4]|uniref:RNA-directed DNA polymerase n=1 Tax=Sulfurovum xiamenensis TaxID=3019066 RepID=A0ABT7QU27_9BACT|nr:reverse transcriptase family protein [Sulfurovum xiamenensis]MDM5264578.1 reverse transcriptase family protein [Sulfurovum xiamenensis]
MNLLHKPFFKSIIVNNKVPVISKEEIKEFSIGKNYFYKIENKNITSLHKQINKIFVEKIPLNNASVAFRKNRSYLHLFEPHRNNYNFLRLDIRSFFHSIEVKYIKKIFKNYIADDEYIDKENTQSLLAAFINVITYEVPENSQNQKFKGKRILPMGFITSPAISNIIFRPLDIQIQKICAQRGITYTRYADDMLFSSVKKSEYLYSDDFIKEIRIILRQMNFKLNEHKTIKSKHTLSLNGYTLQYSSHTTDGIFSTEDVIQEVRLSNKKINIIKKMVHMINTQKKPSDYILKKLCNYQLKWNGDPETPDFLKYNNDQLVNRLTGYRAYLLSIIQFNRKYNCTQEKTIKKYLGIVKDLEGIIGRMR